MKTLDVIKSQDSATKYVCEFYDGMVAEVTYINYPNKDIVCCPTQIACRMGCKFCHLTTNGFKEKLKNRNLHPEEMVRLVMRAVEGVEPRKPLLVSFMGSGEPMMNCWAMLEAIYDLQGIFGKDNVRFAFATMLPKGRISQFLLFTEEVMSHNVPLKMHLSLHFTDDKQRQEYMPNALDIKTSISLLETYMRVTGNPGEIHYTLIGNTNDQFEDAEKLALLIQHRDISVKVLHYSENMGAKPSQFVQLFLNDLLGLGVQQVEYYKPNGLDIGASCGQFNLEKYVKAIP